MAGSDFTAFLALIGQAVVWVIARTIDLLALALLLLSCVLPWRILEHMSGFEGFDDEWRCYAFVSDG